MPIALFSLARALKISGFTIDVLAQRLEQLESQSHPGDERKRFVERTHESVASCEQLYHLLRARFFGLQSLDECTMASLNTEFEQLHHKISESLTRLNSFECSNAMEIELAPEECAVPSLAVTGRIA